MYCFTLKVETLLFGPAATCRRARVCPAARACVSGTGRWRGLCKRRPFSRLKWFCFPYQAAVSEANKKGLRASRYFVWHVFILKLPWPLDHLSLCKGGEDGEEGGSRLLTLQGSRGTRQGSSDMNTDQGWQWWLACDQEVGLLWAAVGLFLAVSLPWVREHSQPHGRALAGESRQLLLWRTGPQQRGSMFSWKQQT